MKPSASLAFVAAFLLVSCRAGEPAGNQASTTAEAAVAITKVRIILTSTFAGLQWWTAQSPARFSLRAKRRPAAPNSAEAENASAGPPASHRTPAASAPAAPPAP